MSTTAIIKPVTVPWVKAQKGKQALTMLTAYDFPTALLLDESGIDMLLVGDSVGTVLYGEPNTLSVTLDDMLRHTRIVAKATQRALVVGDMPFLSYQVSKEQAVLNAGRFLKESHAQAVKLEGGVEMAPTIEAITRAGIPVVAHLGLTPQSIHAMGNYRTHGKTEMERSYLLESALAVEQAGAFAVVLECVEETLARQITAKLTIPTIGIGASPKCDGQVLVTQDLVGLTAGRVPKFARPLAQLNSSYRGAIQNYIARTQSEWNSTPHSEHEPSEPCSRTHVFTPPSALRTSLNHPPLVAPFFTLDIGNSHLVMGLCLPGRILETWRIPHRGRELSTVREELLHILSTAREAQTPTSDPLRRPHCLSVASVVPALSIQIQQWVANSIPELTLFEITSKSPFSFENLTHSPEKVGVDRLINAEAAILEYGSPCIVVDVGTATTLCAIQEGSNERNHRPRFLGGAILPGIRTGMEALARETAQLFEIDLKAPPQFIGKDTQQSLQSGIVYGANLMIDGLIKKFKEELGVADLPVVATGGLLSVLQGNSTEITVFDPDLTLKGMIALTLRNAAVFETPHEIAKTHSLN